MLPYRSALAAWIHAARSSPHVGLRCLAQGHGHGRGGGGGGGGGWGGGVVWRREGEEGAGEGDSVAARAATARTRGGAPRLRVMHPPWYGRAYTKTHYLNDPNHSTADHCAHRLLRGGGGGGG